MEKDAILSPAERTWLRHLKSSGMSADRISKVLKPHERGLRGIINQAAGKWGEPIKGLSKKAYVEKVAAFSREAYGLDPETMTEEQWELASEVMEMDKALRGV